MTTLSTELRNRLKEAVIAARDIAEPGCRAALEALAVHHHEPYGQMSIEERSLRRKLRAHARQLGVRPDPASGTMNIDMLVAECAYEHWHRMLFARFLADNHLLIEPDSGMAISLEECEELAREEGLDTWALSGRYAEAMLPQIFRPDDPLLQVKLARNHQLPLEGELKQLAVDIFTASDALGWVYQFWQTKKKEEVNAAEVKIGARELPAVTQLFTEPYMVSFLLDNALGAWWASRRLSAADLQTAASEEELRTRAALPGMPLTYLRFVQQEDGTWRPAAGGFEAWPEELGELKILDPCCGSGHFLVAVLLMLVPMRMAREGLTAREAVEAVLRDNLHGLELDRRCVELAAFALALTAWKYPDAGGYRPLPELHLACSGLSVSGAKEEWKQLGLGKKNLGLALDWLHDTFRDAPLLGSLLDPTRTEAARIVQWEELSAALDQALRQEQSAEQLEAAVVAQGLAKAAVLLAGKYHWVVTNVPYLARGKQVERLRDFCAQYYPAAKNDLATVFLDRCLELCVQGGTASIVLPQNWLFLTSYKKFREKLLQNDTWQLIARLGPGAFATISGEVVKAILITLSRGNTENYRGGLFDQTGSAGIIRGMDVSSFRTATEKAEQLLTAEVKSVEQAKQLGNPNLSISLQTNSIHLQKLEDYADVFHGITTTDYPRFGRKYWEINDLGENWIYQQSTVNGTAHYSGKSSVLLWEQGRGGIKNLQNEGATVVITGLEAWGKQGISVNQMRNLPVTLYGGNAFDTNVAIVVPKNEEHLGIIYAYCESSQYNIDIRELNQKLNVEYVYLDKTSIDLDHWTKVGSEKYPNGLPQPYSDDPTQWIFHGHPCGSVTWDEQQKWTVHGHRRIDPTVLQIAVARLLGYRWPAELDPAMELAEEQRQWVKNCDSLLYLADEDGIVCIPSVRGEDAAPERLRQLLAAAYGSEWSPAREQELLTASGTPATDLDDWLRNHFFDGHCKLFQHRPFIWHIWDGRKRDGFHALVNYHKLAAGGGKGRQLLEKLTFGHLGDWIILQKDGVKQGTGGAEDRLVAALELEKRLKAILEGEPPFDIFVRWKPFSRQPIGWQPDINDGVRLNIRPFMAPDHPTHGPGADIPGGKKGAGILRARANINWNKDRGADVASAPWYDLGLAYNGKKGDRINDHHLTIADKRAAREQG